MSTARGQNSRSCLMRILTIYMRFQATRTLFELWLVMVGIAFRDLMTRQSDCGISSRVNVCIHWSATNRRVSDICPSCGRLADRQSTVSYTTDIDIDALPDPWTIQSRFGTSRPVHVFIPSWAIPLSSVYSDSRPTTLYPQPPTRHSESGMRMKCRSNMSSEIMEEQSLVSNTTNIK
jgi:hypothetical protein